MRYMKAADVLPPDLLAQVQAYIDGEYLYIPRRETSRKPWGAANGRKAETLARNQEIYRRYREGAHCGRGWLGSLLSGAEKRLEDHPPA